MELARRVTCAATLLLASAGCSKGAEPGSCYREHDNACVEYAPAEGAAGKRLCAGMKWTPGPATCPSTNKLGTCLKKSGAEHVYAGAPNNYSASSAKSACEHAGGSFTGD